MLAVPARYPEVPLDIHPADLDPRRATWFEDAACKGQLALFFPPHAERPETRLKRERRAKSICATCPVQRQCLWYGRVNREYGVWGGENEEERVRAGFNLHVPIGLRRLRAERAASRAGDGEPA